MPALPDIRAVSLSMAGYEDGLGRRSVRFDREVGGMLECLHLRPELWGFERDLRARAEAIASLEDERFARTRTIERGPGGLVVVSELVAGGRLIDVIDSRVRDDSAAFGIDAAIGFLLQALPALASLHTLSLAHGAVAPGRILVTPASQLVLLDGIYAGALERLNLGRSAMWSQFGLVGSAFAGAPRFDRQADVMQAACCALVLANGRPLDASASASTLAPLLREVRELAEIRAGGPFAEGVHRFFSTALPVGSRPPQLKADAAAADIERLAEMIGEEGCHTAFAHFTRIEPTPVRVPVTIDDYEEEDSSGIEQDALEQLREEELEEEELTAGSLAEEISITMEIPPPAEPPAPPPPPAPVVKPAPATPAVAREQEPPPRIEPLRTEPPRIELQPVVSAPPPTPVPATPPAIVDPQLAAIVPQPVPQPVPPLPTMPVAPATVIPAPAPLTPLPPATPRVTSVVSATPLPPSTSPISIAPPPPVLSPTIVAPPIALTAPVPPPITISPSTAPAPAVAPPSIGLAPPKAPTPRVRPDAPAHTPLDAPVRTLPFVDRTTGDEPVRFPLKLAAAAVIVLTVGAFGGYSYLNGPEENAPAASEPPQPSTAAPAPPVASTTTGGLAIDTQPTGAKVSIDGTDVGVTPVKVQDLKPGRHAIVVTTDNATVRRTVRVEAGKIVTLDIPVYSGWVVVFSPIPLDIASGGATLGNTDTGRIILPPGRHVLTLTNREYGFSENRPVEILPGEERPLNVEPKGRVNVNAHPWAEVWIDGKKAGDTPIANLPVLLGTRVFVFKHPQYGERRLTTTITGKPTALTIDLTKP